jgi:hypothetical protein
MVSNSRSVRNSDSSCSNEVVMALTIQLHAERAG